MRRRAGYLFAYIALSLGGGTTIAACGDDDNVVYVTLDAGREIPRDTGLRRDCTPQAVPGFTFTPPQAFQGICSDEDIQNILGNCVFSEGSAESCDAAIAAAADNCLSCIAGAFDAIPSRPLVRYSEEAPLYANTGTCMATIAGETDPNGCAVAFGQVETCAYASCVDSCAGADDELLQACLDKAIGTVCTRGFETFSSEKCGTAYGDATYGFCLSGDKPGAAPGTKLNNLEYYALVTKLACGTRPVNDGGAPKDSGAPDADASGPDADAGSDASDAAADADADATPP